MAVNWFLCKTVVLPDIVVFASLLVGLSGGTINILSYKNSYYNHMFIYF